MPTHAGPNTTAENSIVFSYDVGDTSNSYIGEPTTNHYGDINTSIALRTVAEEYNTSNWTANFSKPLLDIGRVYKHTSGTLNSTWSGNSYGYTLKNYTYPANAIYTLSAWVYVSPDCNISQLNISIEGGGSWIDYNYQYDLGNKGTWQRIWLRVNTLGGFSGNAIPIYPQRWGVTDGSFTGFYAWGGVMLEAKDHITQYTLTSRSVTQGLLPLIGNATIDLSNVSFDSSAKKTFDGTNDYVPVTLNTSIVVYCLEMVWYNNNAIPNNDTVIGGPTTYQTPIEFNGNGTGVHLGAWTGGMTNEAIHIWAGGGATSNRVAAAVGYHHVVFNWNGITYDIWVDGVKTTTYYQNGTTPAGLITATSIKLGRDVDNYCFNGQIPITKIYSRALSSIEVQQNFKQYKSRFNLS